MSRNSLMNHTRRSIGPRSAAVRLRVHLKLRFVSGGMNATQAQNRKQDGNSRICKSSAPRGFASFGAVEGQPGQRFGRRDGEQKIVCQTTSIPSRANF